MNFTNQPQSSVNINIRVPRDLRDISSSLLSNMGINQSQYIRDALQYVVNNNALPWQQSNPNSIRYKYTPINTLLQNTVHFAYNGTPQNTSDIERVCMELDNVQLHSSQTLEELYRKGMTSIHHSHLNSIIFQLTSLLRYNGTLMSNSVIYTQVISNQMRLLCQNIESTIVANNL